MPDAAQALDTVTKTAPVENVVQALPEAGEALEQARPAVGEGLASVQPSAERALGQNPAEPITGLLGGLPLQGWPTGGVAVNGMTLG